MLIKELDPETSYIDFLKVILRYADGSEIELRPENELLNSLDQNYLVLDQGDELEVVFGPVPNHFDGSIYLDSFGYYEPYRD